MDYWLTSGGGWDFDRYRSDFSWDPSDARTSQSGLAELEPLRSRTTEAWDEQAAQIRRALDAVLGAGRLDPPQPDLRVEEDEETASYRRLKVSYGVEPDERVPAYLLVPHSPRRNPAPAMLCLHQTVPWGKREPCGLDGDPELALADELARRGYVCLAPDAICFGERYRAGQPYAHYGDAVAFFGRHPEWSVMGKMAWDTSRAIDALCSLREVDPTRIGCIGHSHGAYGTLFAMLGDTRIRVGVQSCGFTALRSDPAPERWWRRTALLPRLGWFERDLREAPFDFHHLLALVAPRAQFIACALDDDIFPNTSNIGWIEAEVRQVYRVLGEPDALAVEAYAGGHAFPVGVRARAYDFIDSVVG